MSLLPRRPKLWSEAAVWQDVEFGAYTADLPVWEELAAGTSPVVELGSGSGRVALHLAGRGHQVTAIERDPELVEELRGRAENLPVTAIEGDVIQAADEEAGVVIAPLQVIQLLDAEVRARLLTSLAASLSGGGRFAAALVDESTLVRAEALAEGMPPTRPDMREVDGWVYSSEPLWVQVDDDTLRMRRMRERVAPDGDLVRKVHDDVLWRLPPQQLEAEAAAAGFAAVGRREISSSSYEAGSVVVILEAP